MDSGILSLLKRETYMKRIIADFEDHFVLVTDAGNVRAGIKGFFSKDYSATCAKHDSLIKGAEAAKNDEDLEELFFNLGI